MIMLRMSEILIESLVTDRQLRSVKELVLAKAAHGKRELTTKQWTMLLKGILKTLTDMLFEFTLYGVSLDWDRIGYPWMLQLWVESDRKYSSEKLKKWLLWVNDLTEREWIVYHPELSFYETIKGLETIVNQEKR
jgi:hypothetical protein